MLPDRRVEELAQLFEQRVRPGVMALGGRQAIERLAPCLAGRQIDLLQRPGRELGDSGERRPGDGT